MWNKVALSLEQLDTASCRVQLTRDSFTHTLESNRIYPFPPLMSEKLFDIITMKIYYSVIILSDISSMYHNNNWDGSVS